MKHDVLLRLINVRAGYRVGNNFVEAVSSVSLEILRGEIFGLAGESGCGKSTLLKVIYGYLVPPLTRISGEIIFKTPEGDFKIHDLSMKELSTHLWWKLVTWIPQGSMNVLNPTMRVRDHFIELYKLYIGNLDNQEINSLVKDNLNSLGLPESVADAYTTQLSGGMRQRIVIAMALLFNPLLVLADEPTSALDVVTQRVILELLLRLQEERGFTLILVSHDLDVHGVISDRMGVMYAGEIVEVGTTERILTDPLHPYTRALIESLPRVGDQREKKGLAGSPPNLLNPPKACRFHPRCPFAMDICRREHPPTIKVDKNRIVSCWLYVDEVNTT